MFLNFLNRRDKDNDFSLIIENEKRLKKSNYLWNDIILSPASTKKWRENNETFAEALLFWKEISKQKEIFQGKLTELTAFMKKERSDIDEKDLEVEYEFVSKYSLFLFVVPLTDAQMEAHTIVLEMITRLILYPQRFRALAENFGPNFNLMVEDSEEFIDVFHFQHTLNENSEVFFLQQPGFLFLSFTLMNSPLLLWRLIINYFRDYVNAFPNSAEIFMKCLTIKDPEFNKDWSWIYHIFAVSDLTHLLFLLVKKDNLNSLLQAHQQLILRCQHSPEELEQLTIGICNAFQSLSVKYGTRNSNSYRICAGESYWCTFLEVFDYFLSLKRSGLSENSMQQLVDVFTKVVLVPYLCGDPIPYWGRNFSFVVLREVGSGYFDLQEFIYGPLRNHEVSPLILQSLTNQIYTLFSDTSKIPSGFRYEHLLYLPYEFFRRDDHHLKTFHDITKYVAHRFITESDYYRFQWGRTGPGDRLSWYFSEDSYNRTHARLILEDIWLKNTNNNINVSNNYLVKVYKDVVFLRNHKWAYLLHEIKCEELFFIVFYDMMNNLKPTSDLFQVLAIFLNEPLDSEALKQLIQALVTVCFKAHSSNSFSNLSANLQMRLKNNPPCTKLSFILLLDFLDKHECILDTRTFCTFLVQDILMERWCGYSGECYADIWINLKSYKQVQELICAEYTPQIIHFGANSNNSHTVVVTACYEDFTNIPVHYFQAIPNYLSELQHFFAFLATSSVKGSSKLIEIHFIKEGKYAELAALVVEILTLLFAGEEIRSAPIFELLEELYCVEESVVFDTDSYKIVEKGLEGLTEGFTTKPFSLVPNWKYLHNQHCYQKSFSETSPYGIVAAFLTKTISLSLSQSVKPYSLQNYTIFYFPPRNNPWLKKLNSVFISFTFEELQKNLSLPLIDDFMELLLSKEVSEQKCLEESLLQNIHQYCLEIKNKFPLSPQLANQAKEYKLYIPKVQFPELDGKKYCDHPLSSILNILGNLFNLISILMHDLFYAKKKYIDYLSLKINFDEAKFTSFRKNEVTFFHLTGHMPKKGSWGGPCPTLDKLLALKQELQQLLSLPPNVTELIDKLWPIPLLPYYLKKGLDEAEKEYPEKDQFFRMEKAGRYAEFIFKGMLRRPPNGSDEMVKVFQAFGQDFHIKDAFSNGEEEEDTEAHFDVFLSHSWADHDLVSELNKKLKAEGIRTFFDEDRLREDMRDHLATALCKSKFFILFLSEDYNRKIGRKDSTDYCYYEFNAFSSRKDLKHILPIVLNDSLLSIDNWCDRLQAELRTKLYVNLSANHEIEEKYQKLLKRIKKMLNDDDDESPPILPSSPSTQETTENGQSLILAKEEVSGDEIAHLNANTVRKAEDSLHLQPLPSPSLPQDFETAWTCLAEKNRKNPDKLQELLDEWGVETAADLKYLNSVRRTEIANLLKVVPQGKFLEALGLPIL